MNVNICILLPSKAMHQRDCGLANPVTINYTVYCFVENF